MVLWVNVCVKEYLALRKNFRVIKKFLIIKFDCTPIKCLESSIRPILEGLYGRLLEQFDWSDIQSGPRGVFRAFELRVLTLIDCSKIAGC